jgi:phosphoribosyl-ATP pyrophosphohydrolase/phosphoribosyl-AMP cyclohydrolase
VELAFDPHTGLIPAIAQDRLSGEIRMVAWMNREALTRTLETRVATFYSRSRQALWTKGETSGNSLHVSRVVADCDADVLLLLVDATGPSCHTGRPSCFFQELDGKAALEQASLEVAPYLLELERVIEERTSSSAQKSYTRSLLDGGAPKIGAKLREEAAELAQAIADESDERVLSEAADLLYHTLVGLRSRGLRLRGVLEVLAARSHVSGHTEKASRGS